MAFGLFADVSKPRVTLDSKTVASEIVVKKVVPVEKNAHVHHASSVVDCRRCTLRNETYPLIHAHIFNTTNTSPYDIPTCITRNVMPHVRCKPCRQIQTPWIQTLCLTLTLNGWLIAAAALLITQNVNKLATELNRCIYLNN